MQNDKTFKAADCTCVIKTTYLKDSEAKGAIKECFKCKKGKKIGSFT